MLSCQTQSHLRTLSTELISCMKLPTGDFGLELADTVLYPEGGGQPADHGTIDGVSIRHVEKHSDGRVLHHAERSLPLGPVQVEVDWGRRFDHMQQHSGQHLLTAIVQEDLGLATTSFHLGAIQSHIELDGPPNGSECLLELEARVNKEIQLAG